METTSYTNRLIDQTSPYLLQHAHNPVDWYPWDAEALEHARRKDKPILLSIGYSACHWCHVMEHESFEDEEVARVMNEHFVCIKVDREERPDLDKIYQTAHQVLAQRAGGWPLTVFLTPDDLMPFFAGTYFPKTPRQGMPGFIDVLLRVSTAYREQREAIRGQNEQLRGIYARIDAPAASDAAGLNVDRITQAIREFAAHYDKVHGGFGGAPKFPHPTSLELLLHAGATEENLEMARNTLRHMAAGGIYDQIGGGFCRYSVDERWEIPHFEKMLYDNAQLLSLYADAAVRFDDADFRRVAEETGVWVMCEMQAPGGGYYSTLDADSEGHEGKYYIWTPEEIRSHLAADEYAVIERRFGLNDGPNFENRWHLNVRADIDTIARELSLSPTLVEQRLSAARAKLYAWREQRVRPARDEKLLASWNGLMIKGMARAGRLLDRPDFITSAMRALDFVRRELWRDNRLFASTKDGQAHLNAYLDDYAFLIDGALELLQARWRTEDLEFALALARVVLERFEDKTAGGFYFTSSDHERLVHRPKPSADEALPSGNGIAAQALLRVGYLLGDTELLNAAERTLQTFAGRIAQYPSAYGSLLLALNDYLHPPATVILRAETDALEAWREQLPSGKRQHLTFAIPSNISALPGTLAERKMIDGRATAYVCSGHTCLPPATTPADLQRLLEEVQT